ncbi:winged helix-turn-helix transcriptional regulator [Herbiconiux ginsengi]|uniref:Transcriptional regulator, HxlR family n=1 Tax=Herbiconiux ginsengi TaxID=381665 RepID=A0A1H3TEI7_9MICO|nr:helix-turn-helix domain-containing protein [Herbiconiux ginsengi]SDZ47769.1 transcriptional regulator, HxlR family [Herbiconiux ginsengi]
MHERATLDLSTCPIGLSLEVLGQKWTLLIIREAFNGVQRFSDFGAVLGCPRNLLATRLRMLCDHGIMRTELYEVSGERSRVRYELTDAGRELAPTLVALFDWGQKNRLADMNQLAPAKCRCGGRVHAVMICEDGHVVDDVDALTLPQWTGSSVPGVSALSG